MRTTTATFLHGGWQYEPAGVTAAQMNLPYCLAVTALDGDAFVDQFAEERLADPQVLAMIPRIEVRADSELDALGSARRASWSSARRATVAALRPAATPDEAATRGRSLGKKSWTSSEGSP